MTDIEYREICYYAKKALTEFYKTWPKKYYIYSMDFETPFEKLSEAPNKYCTSLNMMIFMGDKGDLYIESVYPLNVNSNFDKSLHMYDDNKQEINLPESDRKMIFTLHKKFMDNLRVGFHLIMASRSPDFDVNMKYNKKGWGVIDTMKYSFDECLDLFLCGWVSDRGPIRLPIKYVADFSNITNVEPTYINFYYFMSSGYIDFYYVKGFSDEFSGRGVSYMQEVFYAIRNAVGYKINCNDIGKVKVILRKHRMSTVSYTLRDSDVVHKANLPEISKKLERRCQNK